MTLILDLANEEEAALHAKAKAEGLSIEQWAGRMLKQALAAVPRRRRISERIAEIMNDVPQEEFARLPKDGARQVDHYVYGLPKRD